MATTFDPRTDSIETKASEIAQQLPALNGRKRERILYRSDIVDLLQALVDHPSCKSARSYSRDGFVSNSYKFRADIAVAEASRCEDGSYTIGLYWVGGKRSYGGGALITVDGRGL